MGGHCLAYFKIYGISISSVQSILSTLFGRWHQRCGLLLSVLWQCVLVVAVMTMLVAVILIVVCEFTASAGLRYDTRCYFKVRSKADMSQLNLPHRTNN